MMDPTGMVTVANASCSTPTMPVGPWYSRPLQAQAVGEAPIGGRGAHRGGSGMGDLTEHGTEGEHGLHLQFGGDRVTQEQKARHLKWGSVPIMMTTSRPSRVVAARNRLSGHTISRDGPARAAPGGRRWVKSKNSSASMLANGSASHRLER